MQKLTWIFLIIIFSSFNSGFAESYSYVTNYRLQGSPVVCAQEFEDPMLPGVERTVIEKTEKAVLDWESKLIEHTGNAEAWDFKFYVISKDAKPPLGCNIIINYERTPENEKSQHSLGTTYTLFFMGIIDIYYLEPLISDETKDVMINGELQSAYAIYGYEKKLQSNIEKTIKHEIGHALGLDHPQLEQSEFLVSAEEPKVASIMLATDPMFEYFEIQYDITDYDVKAVVNLYGEEGPQPYPWLYFSDYIFMGLVFSIVVFYLHRRNKRRRKNSTKLKAWNQKCS